MSDGTDLETPKIGKGKPGPGRPKGLPNKTTALLKDAILIAAQKAGGDGPDGLVNYLVVQATDNPTSFLPLLGKVLPLQITGESGGPVAFVLTAQDVAL